MLCLIWDNIVFRYTQDPLDLDRIRFYNKTTIITRPNNKNRI
jgi:hypothetical protein